MTTLDDAPPRYRLSWTRRIVGAVLCALWVLLLVAYGLTRLTRNNVWLRSNFENPLTGLGVLLVLAVAILVVLLPIRNSAVQGRRQWVRFGLLGVAFFVLIAAGLTHGFKFFTYHPTGVVATSPNGQVRIDLVDVGGFSELHTWSGTGLGTSLTGNLGAPCEFDHATFKSNTEAVVSTSLGDYDIRFTADGRPLEKLPQTCKEVS
jgi:hypothetical protein